MLGIYARLRCFEIGELEPLGKSLYFGASCFGGESKRMMLLFGFGGVSRSFFTARCGGCLLCRRFVELSL